MERREFLQCTHLCGAGLLGLSSIAAAQTGSQEKGDATMQTPLVIRPYQLLCTICSLGAEGGSGVPQYERCRAIRDAIWKNPDVPVTLSCSAGALFSYQESGTEEDTPESEEFNRKRDLDVLQILSLPPGITLPARALFKTLVMGVS
ncbi:MAG TPA: hypothetical protein PKM22_08855, partial [Candidatus Hydrogenedentes bacterium]|nr:hypothetical protein [Candidatus Hydrogenedentota bacterium]